MEFRHEHGWGTDYILPQKRLKREGRNISWEAKGKCLKIHGKKPSKAAGGEHKASDEDYKEQGEKQGNSPILT